MTTTLHSITVPIEEQIAAMVSLLSYNIYILVPRIVSNGTQSYLSSQYYHEYYDEANWDLSNVFQRKYLSQICQRMHVLLGEMCHVAILRELYKRGY